MTWNKRDFVMKRRVKYRQLNEPEKQITQQRKQTVLQFIRRISIFGIISALSINMLPVVSAHGSEHAPSLPQWYGLAILLGGVGIVGTFLGFSRGTDLLKPAHTLAGIFTGLVVVVVGGGVVMQLSQIEEYSAKSMVIPHEWYLPLSLFIGSSIIVLSVIIGQFKWPHRPRYALLGTVLGFWVTYPAIFRGSNGSTHPVGYLTVVSLPILIGYILWIDGRQTLRLLWADDVARRFGMGVGTLMALFFMLSTTMLSFVPDEGVGALSTFSVDTAPIAEPLVLWPSITYLVPQIPVTGMISVGTGLIVFVFALLVGGNAAAAAYQFRNQIEAQSAQSSIGAMALAGPNVCVCCGPLMAELVVVLVGPSLAMPIYWLFLDPSSPIGSVFLAGSIVLLTASYLYSVQNLRMADQCPIP
ncbi:hypothetical protein [Halogeometricum luteum]|uniref:Uncharacterized protein n=1 Tax=Halogeometricum luteum TaxID=2950537 RepID=A0ABU2G7A3_9EURY|nr:hypothetical protein [Halogeometricum sp. S3BR5-2]MDS0296671.1 hypothetical protein [Halogeometricum sp. S3BR5-2]